jgi:hypothetical protein
MFLLRIDTSYCTNIVIHQPSEMRLKREQEMFFQLLAGAPAVQLRIVQVMAVIHAPLVLVHLVHLLRKRHDFLDFNQRQYPSDWSSSSRWCRR